MKANLHSHLLAGFDHWWKLQFGIEHKNLAQVVADKCIRKGLEIYAITNDFPPEFQGEGKSRFNRIFNYARELPDKYRMGKLGDNAFVVERKNKRVTFLNGQSIDVKDGEREYELLTFGSNEIPNGLTFSETSSILKDKGFLGIAEHPFAEGHHGAMSEEELIELYNQGYIQAVEHNGKIAVPNYLSLLPVEKFKGFARSHNERLAEVAEEQSIPMIANDDSDGITHIGTAYTEFPYDKIRMNNGETIVQDLNELIKAKDFETHKGYLNVFSFMRYAAGILTIKDKKLGLREKYLKKYYPEDLFDSE